jgi:hypothetical protein
VTAITVKFDYPHFKTQQFDKKLFERRDKGMLNEKTGESAGN